MKVARRCLAGGLAVAGLHTLLAALLVGETLRMSAYFALCALATAALTIVLHRLLVRAAGGGSRPPGDDGGDGGGGGPPGGPDFPWWPRFERELRAYEHERDRRAAPV